MAESDQISERSDGNSVEDVTNPCLSQTHSNDSMGARGRIPRQRLTSSNGSDDETLSRSEDDGVDNVAFESVTFENATSSTLGSDQNSTQDDMLHQHMSEAMQPSDQAVGSNPEPEVADHLDRVILDQINIQNELDNRTNDQELSEYSLEDVYFSIRAAWWIQAPASRQQIAAMPTSVVGQDEASQNCNICLGEFELDEEIKHLPCRHFFHSECLDAWLNRDYRCPYCRSPCMSS